MDEIHRMVMVVEDAIGREQFILRATSIDLYDGIPSESWTSVRARLRVLRRVSTKLQMANRHPFIEKLTESTMDYIRVQLESFRNLRDRDDQKRRLEYVPFPIPQALFRVGKYEYFPCNLFGKQLVLKIVDELVYL